MSRTEYRVSWKREGLRRKSRGFIGRAAAERHAEKLRNGDPHWRCDEGHGHYFGPEWEPTCMPDIVEGPVVEQREVGGWELVLPLGQS